MYAAAGADAATGTDAIDATAVAAAIVVVDADADAAAAAIVAAAASTHAVAVAAIRRRRRPVSARDVADHAACAVYAAGSGQTQRRWHRPRRPHAACRSGSADVGAAASCGRRRRVVEPAPRTIRRWCIRSGDADADEAATGVGGCALGMEGCRRRQQPRHGVVCGGERRRWGAVAAAAAPRAAALVDAPIGDRQCPTAP